MTQNILYILLAVVLLALIYLIYSHVKLRHLADEAKRLAGEAEASHRQAMEEQRRNQQLKQEMTSNIAHELKTPVSSIRGYLEILLGDKPIDDEKRKYFLQRSYAQTLRLSDLINDVSLINKMEESEELFVKEKLLVRYVFNEVQTDLTDDLQAHNIRVENKLSPSLEIMGNHSLMYAIFRNLLENVVQHAGDNLKVVVESYKEDEERYYFHFYDNGPGVDNSYLDRIFDRFLRIDEGRSRKLGGSGLGLAIVKHSVQFHGGDIYAKNRDEGGLEFFFSLKR
jgi:signal transduction histidine kinase